ncbi:hypothetical protein ABK040_010267 [Willaertia magna]
MVVVDNKVKATLSQTIQDSSIKTVKVPIEFYKPTNSSSNEERQRSLSERIVDQLMSSGDDSSVRGYCYVNIPVPPTSELYNDNSKVERFNPSQEKFHQSEIKRVTKVIQNQVDKNTSSNNDSNRQQWLARALKRNPEILYLSERLRPLSKQNSHSSYLYQKYSVFSSSKGVDASMNAGSNVASPTIDSPTQSSPISNPSNLKELLELSTTDIFPSEETSSEDKTKHSILDHTQSISTTENRDVLSRETLLQLVYQHLAQRGLYRSIKTMEQETGVKYNGFRNDQTVSKDSLIVTLLSLGIKDIENPYSLPIWDAANLDDDVEVQTASIYTHFEDEYIEDLRVPFWKEVLNPNEDNLEFSETGELKGATLNKLVEKLTEPYTADGKFTTNFLITYRSFTVPEILLKKLLERYQVPKRPPSNSTISEEDWNKNNIQIQIRTGALLSKWIDEYFALDWNDNMIRELTIFIEDVLLKNPQSAGLGKKIRSRLDGKIQGRYKDAAQTIFSDPPPPPVVPANVFSPKLSIWDIKEEELAKQLTKMDHGLYRNIEAHELLNCSWSKPKLRHRSKNVIKSIEFFNKLSNWFATQILTEESLRERKNKMTKLMNVAKHMFKLNNFNSLMALNSAFENAAVHRLKVTVGEVDKNSYEEFKETVKVMVPDSAFKSYRNYIKQYVKPPLNIYLGIYLTDLTFIEDGNPDRINSTKTSRNLINWRKRQFVANVISEVMQYKNPPYNIQPVHQIQELLKNTLDNHVIMDETEMFNLSLKVEPRGKTKEELKQ